MGTLPPTDIAILAVNNSAVRTQQVRVAAQCVAAGLRTTFLIDPLHGGLDWIREQYATHGTEMLDLDIRAPNPISYPSAIGTLQVARAIDRVLAGFRPKVLLTHTDADGLFRVMQLWARSAGVHGAVLQEGASVQRRPGWRPGHRTGVRRWASRAVRHFGPPMLRLVETYEYAQFALVWGESLERRLRASGRPADTIFVTGNPGFDHTVGRESLADSASRTIFFAQQPQPNWEVEMAACSQIIHICADRISCRLLVRPHPRGDLKPNVVRQLGDSTSRPGLIEIVSGGELTDHLSRASVFLTYYSTAAYDAAIRGIPLVFADWVSPMYHLDAPAFGAALSASHPEDLEPMIRRALDDDECRRSLYGGGEAWLREHVGVLDGRAAERVAAILARLAAAGEIAEPVG